VTSGGFSFSLGHGIATAYVAPDLGEAPLTVDLRGETVPARRDSTLMHRRGAHLAQHPPRRSD
jgi:glycine cleavage system aminomethyltransferase T